MVQARFDSGQGANVKTKAMKDTYENYLDYLISGYDLIDYLVDLYYNQN